MSAIILDTETTGIDEPQIIEAAWIALRDPPGAKTFERTFEQRYKPAAPISWGAMATHHIIPEDLDNEPPYTEFQIPGWAHYVIGHNVDFDLKAASNSGPQPSVKAICTLAMARHLWPTVDSHSLGAMTYFLSGARSIAREGLEGAHNAVQDCLLCEDLLSKIIAQAGPFESWEAVYQFSEMARVPEFMPFGKHKGRAVKDLPADYKRWLLSQPDVSPYLVKALQGGDHGKA